MSSAENNHDEEEKREIREEISSAIAYTVAEPQTAEPQTAEPQTAEPQKAEPQTAEPQTAEPQTAEPQTAEPQTSQPKGFHAHNKVSPIVAIPPGAALMVGPQSTPAVPPGLEYLVTLDQLLIHQQVEVLEALVGWEGCNKYKIMNSREEQVLFAAEESGTCMRMCCGSERGFILHITDNKGQEVIRVRREYKYCAGNSCCACLDCCSHELEVEAPVGTICGYVRQMRSVWTTRYMIRDADGQEVLCIQAPCCMRSCCCCCCCCCGNTKFKVLTSNRSQEVGAIAKTSAGLAKRLFTNASNFNASFPMDLDVRMKAVVLAAAFLIDFMFFEKKD